MAIAETCPDCGVDEATDTCCVWAKARAYDDLKAEYDALEAALDERLYEIRELEDIVTDLQSELSSYT